MAVELLHGATIPDGATIPAKSAAFGVRGVLFIGLARSRRPDPVAVAETPARSMVELPARPAG